MDQSSRQESVELSFSKEYFKQNFSNKRNSDVIYSLGPGNNAYSKNVEGQLHMISVGISNNLAVSKSSIKRDSITPRVQANRPLNLSQVPIQRSDFRSTAQTTF